MTGKIESLFKSKGYGFLKTEDGKSYFFHTSGCNGKYEKLNENDEVYFEEEESKKGLRATNVRAF